MVIRRKKPEGETEPAQEGSSLDLNEELLKKTLAINPELRKHGENTEQILESMRREAQQRATTGRKSEPEALRAQKKRELEQALAELAATLGALEHKGEKAKSGFLRAVEAILSPLSERERPDLVSDLEPQLRKLGLSSEGLLKKVPPAKKK